MCGRLWEHSSRGRSARDASQHGAMPSRCGTVGTCFSAPARSYAPATRAPPRLAASQLGRDIVCAMPLLSRSPVQFLLRPTPLASRLPRRAIGRDMSTITAVTARATAAGVATNAMPTTATTTIGTTPPPPPATTTHGAGAATADAAATSCRRLEHRVAVVTASTDGIGLAIATRLAREGAHVVVSSRKKVCGPRNRSACRRRNRRGMAAQPHRLRRCRQCGGRSCFRPRSLSAPSTDAAATAASPVPTSVCRCCCKQLLTIGVG